MIANIFLQQVKIEKQAILKMRAAVLIKNFIYGEFKNVVVSIVNTD